MVKRREDYANPVASAEEWKQARMKLMEKEKEATRAADELAKERRSLPWMAVSEEYTFQGSDGPVELKDLFGDKQALFVYHLMFDPAWEKGCPSCSLWLDCLQGMFPHLARKAAVAAIADAAMEKLKPFVEQKGWTFPVASAAGTSFGRDMHVSFTDEELADPEFRGYNFNRKTFCKVMPGASVFVKVKDGDQDKVFLTYNMFARGLEPLNSIWGILDRLPDGTSLSSSPSFAFFPRSGRSFFCRVSGSYASWLCLMIHLLYLPALCGVAGGFTAQAVTRSAAWTGSSTRRNMMVSPQVRSTE
mmetsp:Transcript_1157/g.2117  ORF Transcript_1157/g.2117 Transcript_1157/m.2117 type:complete len:303 (+) Transcript_1157:3-911(+)